MSATNSERTSNGGKARSSSGISSSRWAVFALLTAMLGIGLLTACPRDPESPEGEGNLIPLFDPDSVLSQIRAGVQTGGVITEYMNAFTQDYVFNPDQVDSITLTTQIPGVFDNWDFEAEQGAMGVVLNTHSARALTFVDVESTSVGSEGREVVLREDYTLVLDGARYQGQAEFFMIREASNDWRIFRWRDRQSASDPDTTWGILKGRNRPLGRGVAGGTLSPGQW